jgi:hypothetical protein
MPTSQARFSLGQTVVTLGAIAALQAAGQDPGQLLERHQSGDWGEVPHEAATANEISVDQGYRIQSVYPLTTGVTVWIITEADRSATTILLPSDY